MSGYLIIVREKRQTYCINTPNSKRSNDFIDNGRTYLIDEKGLDIFSNSIVQQYKIDDLQRFKKFVIKECYHKEYTDHVDLNGLWYVSKTGLGILQRYPTFYVGCICSGDKQYDECKYGIRRTESGNYN